MAKMSKKHFNPKSHLEKYGWSEGNGLGKSGSGMTQPIKAKVKSNSLGVGFDVGETFEFHWWDHMFNKAAENIKVDNDEDGNVRMQAVSELNMSTKKEKVKTFLSKELLYGCFVKSTSTFTDGKETKSDGAEGSAQEASSSSDDDGDDRDCSTVFKMSDEALVKICGGRTAHKGARHGLKLSGKLARLEQQEKLHSQVASEENTDEKTKKKKKKKKKNAEEDIEEVEQFIEKENVVEEIVKDEKKRKRKMREEEEEDVKSEEPEKKKKKKKKVKTEQQEETAQVQKTKKKKKKKSKD